jgi:hypothetical protein
MKITLKSIYDETGRYKVNNRFFHNHGVQRIARTMRPLTPDVIK